MRTYPYRNIGVTGITRDRDLFDLQERFGNLMKRHVACQSPDVARPRFMAGILASCKTANGLPNKWPGRFPPRERFKPLFELATAPHTLGLCHISVDDPLGIVDTAGLVREWAGRAMRGFQLNLKWPEPVLLQELKARDTNLHILLQIGPDALNEFARGREATFSHYDLPLLQTRIESYGRDIDEVLLDMSDGTGTSMKPARLYPVVEMLMEQFPWFGIGVAGGLCAETMYLVKDLSKVCPYLSVDAQGRLRNQANDSLNVERAAAYLRAAFDLFYPV